MQIDSGWVSAIVGALVAGGGAGAWLQRRWDEERKNLPILRPTWRALPDGWNVWVEIVNRLDEDLYIVQVEAKAPFVKRTIREYPDGMTRVPAEYDEVLIEPMVACNHRLVPGATRGYGWTVSGVDTPRWLSLTMSSSLKTIRCKRLIIEDKPRH